MFISEARMSKPPVILLTGTSGQVGFELSRSLQGLGEVIALERATLDLSDPAKIRDAIRTVKPSIIINPAAYTAVDQAETNAEYAIRINADAPRILAEEAARNGIGLIHYSTDYVFNGMQAKPYIENDTPCPQNVYGQSKLAGEQAIIATGCMHLILRTSWVYSRRGKNFLLTMLKLGAERSELRVISDQIGAPTWANTIAAATAHIVAQSIASDNPQWWQSRAGIYHLTTAGETSWHGFAEAILEIAMGKQAPSIVPIATSEYPTPAKRPMNSRLDHRKLTKTFGLYLPDWRHALRLCMNS